MKVFLAADHAGLRMKATLFEQISLLGYEVEDVGAFELDPNDDYPVFAKALAAKITDHPGSLGVMCAGSGQGEAMCLNRHAGIRAAVLYALVPASEALNIEGAHSEDGYDVVRLARKHNNANVLSIGSRFIAIDEAQEAVRIFLTTPFSEDERHVHRLAQY